MIHWQRPVGNDHNIHKEHICCGLQDRTIGVSLVLGGRCLYSFGQLDFFLLATKKVRSTGRAIDRDDRKTFVRSSWEIHPAGHDCTTNKNAAREAIPTLSPSRLSLHLSHSQIAWRIVLPQTALSTLFPSLRISRVLGNLSSAQARRKGRRQ